MYGMLFAFSAYSAWAFCFRLKCYYYFAIVDSLEFIYIADAWPMKKGDGSIENRDKWDVGNLCIFSPFHFIGKISGSK